MISISAALQVVLLLIICGLVFWLLQCLIDYCALPAPFAKVAKFSLPSWPCSFSSVSCSR